MKEIKIKQKNKHLTIRLAEELKNKLEWYAKDSECSMGAIIRKALIRYFEKEERKK